MNYSKYQSSMGYTDPPGMSIFILTYVNYAYINKKGLNVLE